MRRINEVIIHCTATRPEWRAGDTTSAKVAEVKNWHVRNNGWSDIGYHFLIDRDGTRATGRPLERTGAHVKGKNTGTIGVALFGGHGSSETDQFSDNFTPEQDAELRKLLSDLGERFPITRISGHNQYAAKACPGFTVSEWMVQEPCKAPKANPAPTPKEQPQGLLAALISAILSIFGGKK